MKTKYRFRVLKPKPSEWIRQEGENEADAVQTWHLHAPIDYSSTLIQYDKNSRPIGEREHFIHVEMESGERLISRICTSGIYRSGGRHRDWKPRTLVDIAKDLEIEVSVLEGPWGGEEDYA